MKANEKLIGKTMISLGLGRVTVDSAIKNSRTAVNVTCIDRGEGWDEKTQSYKGVKTNYRNGEAVGWSRGENRHFGQTFEVHIDTLEPLKKP